MRLLSFVAGAAMLSAASTFFASPASASTILVTADSGTGTTTTFNETGVTHTSGPVNLNGFTVTGNPYASYGNGNYGLVTNGAWDWSRVGTNSATGDILFDLNGAYDFVGAFLNYAPGSGSDATITALGLDGTTVLGTYDLAVLAPVSTPGATDAGAFRGISSTSNNIGYLELSGDYIVTHSIETQAASAAVTPEPSSIALLGTGMLGVVGTMRKRLAHA